MVYKREFTNFDQRSWRIVSIKVTELRSLGPGGGYRTQIKKIRRNHDLLVKMSKLSLYVVPKSAE